MLRKKVTKLLFLIFDPIFDLDIDFNKKVFITIPDIELQEMQDNNQSDPQPSLLHLHRILIPNRDIFSSMTVNYIYYFISSALRPSYIHEQNL